MKSLDFHNTIRTYLYLIQSSAWHSAVELSAPRPAGIVTPELVATIDSAHVPVVLRYRLWARNRGACAVLLLPLNLAHFLGLRAGGHDCHDLAVHPRRCGHWPLLEDSHLTPVRGKCIKQEGCVCVCARVHYLFLNLTVFRAVGKPRRSFLAVPQQKMLRCVRSSSSWALVKKLSKNTLWFFPGRW